MIGLVATYAGPFAEIVPTVSPHDSRAGRAAQCSVSASVLAYAGTHTSPSDGSYGRLCQRGLRMWTSARLQAVRLGLGGGGSDRGPALPRCIWLGPPYVWWL
jgi:hypothetical protein